MDDYSLMNEVNNQGQIQALNQGIYDSPITQNFFGAPEQSWHPQMLPIGELRLESFKLGDDAAANFPYIIDPIRTAYSETMQALQKASQPTNRAKRGILLLGESNAGKTRLGLEALKQVLHTWSLLRWQPDFTNHYIPPVQVLRERPLVLFLDDLHEYVSTKLSSLKELHATHNPSLEMTLSLENPRVMALRTLLETLFQLASNVVIVATCRSEHLESVNAELGDHLLIRLKEIRLPSFNPDAEDSQVKQLIGAFQQEGSVHLGDWDGTIGSLVLGLSRKRDQYCALPEHAQIVLKAIKLLARAFIFTYPEEYVRKICIEIFPKARRLQEDGLWQDTVDLLLRNQFVIEDFNKNTRDPSLTIRKDSYLEKVISDYPPIYRPSSLEQDLTKLQND